MGESNRILAAALGFVAATGACGAFGTFATFENRALFGEEPAASSTTVKRRLVAEGKDGELESPTGFKAFLVGADDYADALDLRFVKNDVDAFAARLVEIGFDEKNIVVLKTGGDFSLFPTKANIESRFTAFYRNLRPGDFVVVYLSGHGLRSAETGESFFAPIDVKPLDPFKTSVSIDKILAALARSQANFRWAIVDACRNDPTGSTSGSASAIFKTRSSGAAKALTEITDAPSSVALLQSCQPGRVSFEGDGDMKNGLFTLGLLEALDPNGTKADVDQNGALTFTEVLKYVSERTNELAGERYGESQVPCWSGSFTDFAILTDLRRDGVAREDWERAEALYREAAALRRERRYPEAAEKLDLATAINKNNAEYAAARAELAELLEAQTALREARQAAETAAQEAAQAEAAAREAVDEANAAEKAEAERKAREAAEAKQRAEEAARRAASATNGESGADVAWDANPEAGTRKTLEIDGVEYAFRYCPPGTFTMGDGEESRKVTLTRGFWTLETEVTQRMWTAVTGKNPSCFNAEKLKTVEKFEKEQRRETRKNRGKTKKIGRGEYDASEFPVENVSWDDSQAFLEALNAKASLPPGFVFRLSTDAEWEYACRAGTTTKFFWGDDASDKTANTSGEEIAAWRPDDEGKWTLSEGAWGRPRRVGSYPANPWGLFDMHGNVYEYCVDGFTFLLGGRDAIDPVAPEDKNDCVIRGGSWNKDANFARSAGRFRGGQTSYCNDESGFRFVVAPELKANAE